MIFFKDLAIISCKLLISLRKHTKIFIISHSSLDLYNPICIFGTLSWASRYHFVSIISVEDCWPGRYRKCATNSNFSVEIINNRLFQSFFRLRDHFIYLLELWSTALTITGQYLYNVRYKVNLSAQKYHML